MTRSIIAEKGKDRAVHVSLHWDDPAETIVRWEFSGFIGVVSYIIPMNETAMRAMTGEADALDAIIHIGWKMPFPDRGFQYVRQPILAAPPALKTVVIACRNPLTALLVRRGLLTPEVRARGVHLVGSLPAARRLIAGQRGADHSSGSASSRARISSQ